MKKLAENPTGSRRAQRSRKEIQRQREKRWSQQCHAGRKALPWHFANQREVVVVVLVVVWAGGGVHRGRERKGQRGYLQWGIPSDLNIFKERKPEILGGGVNLSLTPWLAAVHYPQQESSQTWREGRKAVEPHLIREETEISCKNKGRRSCHVDTTLPKSVRPNQRDDHSASVWHSSCRTVRSLSPKHKPLIQLRSLHYPRQSSLCSPHP